MNPQEKAKEIFNKYYELGTSVNNNLNRLIAKKYATIAVDFSIELNDFHIEFLQEVKQEIEKL